MKICEACGEEITGSGIRFCSIKCSNRKRPDRNLPTTKFVKECEREHCKETFETIPSDERKYCSKSCAAKVNNQGVSRHHLIVTSCLRCTKPTGARNKKFCSRDCFSKYQIEEWLAGRFDAQNKYAIANWARRYVFERAGWQCEGTGLDGLRCKENRYKPVGTTVLTVDHIDGNWQNSWPDNLRALCPTCHALTPTYGAGNMGNGRTWKKDYKQYQSKLDRAVCD